MSASLAVRLASIVAVLGTCLAWLALASAALAASPSQTLGVYVGAGQPGAVAEYEGRLGRPVVRVHDAFAKESWSKIESPEWWTAIWGSSPYANRMLYTVPLIPNTGGTLAAGAAGRYDDHFAALARTLVAGGQGKAVLRLGPEFNGNWFGWTIAVPSGAADYAAYWRRVVTAMRAVPGAEFRFDWCPNGGSSWVDGKPIDPAAAYPGDAYVDFIGLDQYDQSWSPDRADPGKRWSEYLDRVAGLRWHRQFAATHGKPMTFPEWGVARRADGYGGGDSPEFISYMYEWIRDNDVAYHLYFEYADGVADFRLFNGLSPNSAARFLELFGPTPAPALATPLPAAKPGAGKRRTARTGTIGASVVRITAERRRRHVLVRGRVTPAVSGQVRLSLERRPHARWTVTTRVRANLRGGRFSRTIERSARMPSRVVVRYAGDRAVAPVQVRSSLTAPPNASRLRPQSVPIPSAFSTTERTL